jgi:hypothetical protein
LRLHLLIMILNFADPQNETQLARPVSHAIKKVEQGSGMSRNGTMHDWICAEKKETLKEKIMRSDCRRNKLVKRFIRKYNDTVLFQTKPLDENYCALLLWRRVNCYEQ